MNQKCFSNFKNRLGKNVQLIFRQFLCIFIFWLIPISFANTTVMTSDKNLSKNSEKSSTQEKENCHFIPPNKLRFPIRSFGQMSEKTFNQVIHAVEEVYDPIFRQMGQGRFHIRNLWTDDTVNAVAFICDPAQLLNNSASDENTKAMKEKCSSLLYTAPNVTVRTRVVEMYGGLARHPLMTAEGLLLVACHEIGHHLGGAPLYSGSNLSTEGQSDYFSTAKCAKTILSKVPNNEGWIQVANIPLEVRTSCQNAFPNNLLRAAVCMRSSMAGLSLARVLASFSSDWRQIDFSRTNKIKVNETFQGHPEAQCRLDTLYAGALCNVSEDIPFSLRDPRAGACLLQRNQFRSARPSCWYKDPLVRF
ncbi:MAG: hypothetical protein J0M15_03290 [Deltaproteobacteria bacterium]|nr:hypothetical protein [Deltaproteobacteria bacterium]